MTDVPTKDAAVAEPPPPDPALRPDPAAGLPADDPSLSARPPGTFEVLATAGPARAARLWTAHGPVDTPCFMPVGTYGAVKGLTPDELCSVGSQIISATPTTSPIGRAPIWWPSSEACTR